MSGVGKSFLVLAVAGGLGALGWALADRLRSGEGGAASRPASGPAPVEVAPVRRGPIEDRRTFSGTLEARAKFAVAPKVGGRVERMVVDVADTVAKGQVVAHLDDDEFVQAVAQAEADLAVARARVAEGESALDIARRKLDRMETLRGQGVASESELDGAVSEHLAAKAALEVARSQVSRAEAALETSKIRLGYTKVSASWSGPEAERVVAERFVDEGDTVAANASLISIVSLSPIHAVFFATERDYGRLAPGQEAALTTDAYPGRTFRGRITRISPVFRQASRQARVELEVDNPGNLLKPGLFVRAEVVLARVEDAVVVPLEALARRDGEDGVFVVDAAGKTVAWRAVRSGIRQGGRVQVLGDGVEGRVVTLGQQLLRDGSRISIPEAGEPEGGSDRDP